MMSPQQSPGLASSLNFSLTKKRFEMMKRRTANSTKRILILSVIPVLGAMVYVFSEKVTPITEGDASPVSMKKDSESRKKSETSILLRADGKIEIEGQILEISQLTELINSGDLEFNLARISAETDVETGLLADVQEILRKNEIREVIYDREQQQEDESSWQNEHEIHNRNAYIIVEDENMVYTNKSYYQLTDEEKKGLLGPMKPREKENPEYSLFQSWMDDDTYALWIDGVVIPNEKLNSYTPKDFAGFFQSRVMSNARSDRFPQPYQVHLYTDSYFNENFGPESEIRQPLTNTDTITLTQRKVTWHKDISRYPDPTTAYLQKYVRYENLRTSGALYTHKSLEEKAMLNKLYQELNSEFSKSSDKRKKNLKEPINPSSNIQRNGIQGQSSSDKIKVQPTNTNKDKAKVSTLVFLPEIQSKALKEYLTRYGKFHTKTFENKVFTQPSNQEIVELQTEYHELDKSYLSLSFEERKRVSRAIFPYAKIEKEGKVIYKKMQDLTPEERQELGC